MNYIETIKQYYRFTDFVRSLNMLPDELWLEPIAMGKASIGEIIGHLLNWDTYIIGHTIPAVNNGGNMEFPDFDSFNQLGYELARKTYTKVELINMFVETRSKLCDLLLEMPFEDITRKLNPNSLLYLIEELNEHDEHHLSQIMNKLNHEKRMMG
ncbi:DinB family protein [Chengkuizengella axinellae]|uniref:DinB family protein n=1 Tax=Chengkuizengella axinellae TaxID=3064388 RepID=A0ABT9IU43_9BACL|nr:DinB family protein [Chengkuizengella sp. 2205SS18-9]MDP5272838.1 DinB family protein [Chengkuizengella sp. 2205SS18-9]